MNVPPVVSLRVSCKAAVDLSGLIMGMTISTGRKNPYHVYFPKTDELGRSKLSEESFRGQFKDHWAEGLMDYSGNLESASQRVVFHLFNPSLMRKSLALIEKWPLLPYEGSVWRSRQEVIAYYLSCRNEQFDFAETPVELAHNGEVGLEVTSRGV
jgi:hypothetical protein